MLSFTGKTSRGLNSSTKDNKPKTSSPKTNKAAELRRKANEAKLSKFLKKWIKIVINLFSKCFLWYLSLLNILLLLLLLLFFLIIILFF